MVYQTDHIRKLTYLPQKWDNLSHKQWHRFHVHPKMCYLRMQWLSVTINKINTSKKEGEKISVIIEKLEFYVTKKVLHQMRMQQL